PDRRRVANTRRGLARLPSPPSPDPDDVPCDDHRTRADGAQTRRRQRGLRAARARDHWWPERLSCLDHLHRAGGLPAGLRTQEEERSGRTSEGGASMKIARYVLPIAVLFALAAPAAAQAVIELTLKRAEEIAVKNHPQVNAAALTSRA